MAMVRKDDGLGHIQVPKECLYDDYLGLRVLGEGQTQGWTVI